MNSDMDYQQKYLKYKKKYLDLKQHQLQPNSKEEEEDDESSLTGGYAYMTGKYVFFIPKNMETVVDSVGSDKIIKSLDKFTTSLGNCTKFVRIGSSSFDPTHQYDTIYTNQSSFNVMSREANKAAQATKEAYAASSEAAKKAYEVSAEAAKKAYEVSTVVAKNAYDISKKAVNTAKTAYDSIKHRGGDNDCDKLPIKLSDIGLTGIKSLNDVNEELVNNFVNKINNTQGSEKIGRVIVVEKTGMFGNVHLYQDFEVSYGNDTLKVTKK